MQARPRSGGRKKRLEKKRLEKNAWKKTPGKNAWSDGKLVIDI